MSKKSFDPIQRGGNLLELKAELNKTMENATLETLEKILVEPNKENIVKSINAVKSDSAMTKRDKERIIEVLRKDYIDIFNFDNCPEDYDSLKKEAKFLSDITQYSLILMAQRLLKIRDGALYRKDGYTDFKSFIENEMNVSRRTAYNYIEIVECFGAQLVARAGNLEYSKLLPAIPLLKSDIANIPKEEIRDKFIRDMNEKSKYEVLEEARRLKMKYGLITENKEDKLVSSIEKFKKSLPRKPSEKELNILDEFISFLTANYMK